MCFLLVFFDTLFTPIDICLCPVFLKPVQKRRGIIAVATKANIALLTTATHLAFTHIATFMGRY